MATSVLPAVERWHDFYVMTGGASAALVGLLFTTMALRSDWASESSLAAEQGLWTAASLPLSAFLDILLLSLVFLVPEQNALGVGLPVLALAVLTGLQLFWVARRYWAISSRSLRSSGLAMVVCYLGQAAVGVTIVDGESSLLWMLSLVIAVLILSASFVAWQLLRNPILARAATSSTRARHEQMAESASVDQH